MEKKEKKVAIQLPEEMVGLLVTAEGYLKRDRFISELRGATRAARSWADREGRKVTRIVIDLKGGIVQQVISSGDVEVVVVDHDEYLLDEDDPRHVEVDGDWFYVFAEDADVDPSMVERIFSLKEEKDVKKKG